MCFSTMYSPEPVKPKRIEHWRCVPVKYKNGLKASRKIHYIRTGSTRTLCGKHDEAKFRPGDQYLNCNTVYFEAHPEELCSECLKIAKSMLFNNEIASIY